MVEHLVNVAWFFVVIPFVEYGHRGQEDLDSYANISRPR
jgi:hypothetical protein